MTLRCINCGKLTNDENDDKCKKDGMVCNFQKVAVIHFISPNGTGRIVGKGRRLVREPNKPSEDHVENVELRLCCNTTYERPMLTDVRHAVTCLTCIANSPAEEAPPPEEQSQTTPTPAPMDVATNQQPDATLSNNPFPTEMPDPMHG